MGRRRLIELSPIEEAMLVWQDAAVPWNSQYVVTAPRLDVGRVRDAFNAALRTHSLAMCLVDADDTGRWWWVHDDDADVGEVHVVECADEATLRASLGAQLDEPVPTDRAPLLRAVIARTPEQDTLITTLSHAFCDGLGMIRLLRSVGRAYRGEPDASPAVDIATAHAVLSQTPTSLTGLTQQWARQLRMTADALAERSRLAGRGGSAKASGFRVLTYPVDLAALTAARRAHDASFDAFVMAALHVTIDRWNRTLDAPAECIGVTQAINLRPREWWDDVVVNLATFVSVLSDPGDRVDLDAALARVTPQLDPESCRARALEVARAARTARVVPRSLRQQALAQTPSGFFDTCVLSNAGYMQPLPRFDDAVAPTLHAATPAMPGVGLTIGLHTTETEVRLLTCYRRELFDDAGIDAFLSAFAATLT